MDLLAGESRAAKRKRIVDRFLRMLIIGFFLEDKEKAPPKDTGGPGKATKKAPRAAKQEAAPTTMRQKADTYCGPLMMVAFIVLILAAKIGEESFAPGQYDENRVDYYGALGLARGAGIMEVRKAYKALALSWHPDKNPDCESCKQRFELIGEAYETLSDPERKKAYDNQRADAGKLNSAVSTELTTENFEKVVLRSNDVWFVQVYDPADGGCQSFHPMWEDIGLKMQDVAKFGRIDMTKQRKVLEHMPQRVMLTPIVFRFARGFEPEIFLWSGREERNSAPLSRFIIDNYPEMPKVAGASAIKKWWASPKPRIAVVGPQWSRRGTTASEDVLTYLQSVAHKWQDFVDIAYVESDEARLVFGSEAVPRGKDWCLLQPLPGGEVNSTRAPLQKVYEVLQSLVSHHLLKTAPVLSVRNYQQLCGTDALSVAPRTYCLVVVDAADGGPVAKVLEEIETSRTAYAQELLEMGSGDEEAESGSEQLHIQPVRILTRSTRWPWQPAAGPGFSDLWRSAGHAKSFVLELETSRVAPVKSKALVEIFQQVAYDDLKFGDLQDGFSMARAVADPDAGLRHDLMAAMSSPLGAVFTFLTLAATVAVLPELFM